jgi:hypothetical protein
MSNLTGLMKQETDHFNNELYSTKPVFKGQKVILCVQGIL